MQMMMQNFIKMQQTATPAAVPVQPIPQKQPQPQPEKKSQLPAIKKPLSSYQFFFKEKVQELKTQNPSGEKFDVTAAAKKISEMWKLVDNDAKLKFQEMALVEKQRYENEMK